MEDNLSYSRNVIKQCFARRDSFMYCLDKITSPDVFSSPETRLYWQVFQQIEAQKLNLCHSTVTDELKLTNNDR